MLRFPLARRALLAATACSAVVLPVVLSPTPAWAEAPNPSACKGLHHGNPPGSLAITTAPPSGTVLRPGDEVEVTATWDTADWPGPVLHKVLNCLVVNGEIDYGRSTQEKPTDNDGLYRYRFTVPSGADGRICDRVRLSGRLVEDGPLAVQKSNTVCFAVATAGSAGTPGTPADTTTAAAPAPEAPAPLEPTPAAPADAPLDAAAAPPAGEPAPTPVISSVASRPTLPR
ncbi:MAG TPA: hypothetical protein VFS16_14505, partial [Acidimicrobiia bacterium]|nr:hypothetical protein [Acidimicrobiia bacterium]